MKPDDLKQIFDESTLAQIMPEERSDRFFDALFGDVDEGAYTIGLTFHEKTDDQLVFHLTLKRRPGKCLVCSLTYGLPEVFQRHPIIDIKGMVADIGTRLGGGMQISGWRLEPTNEVSADLHVIPLVIDLDIDKDAVAP